MIVAIGNNLQCICALLGSKLCRMQAEDATLMMQAEESHTHLDSAQWGRLHIQSWASGRTPARTKGGPEYRVGQLSSSIRKI